MFVEKCAIIVLRIAVFYISLLLASICDLFQSTLANFVKAKLLLVSVKESMTSRSGAASCFSSLIHTLPGSAVRTQPRRMLDTDWPA